ncbi:MAG: ribosome biogenesis GTP-binding protein YihA/YsxC [Cystobacterineae bacterium]|nr:ribosome biogenesis GTP-binding protein YihA/YsxC [Cystobacterineae bacterium]
MEANSLNKLKVLKADFVVSATQAAHFPPPVLPEVAFVGRSNVGKSSLLNVLTGKSKLARVSRTPGRTRLINFFEIELYRGLQKLRLRLVDLPGYGYAKVSKAESENLRQMLRGYLQRGPCLQVLVWLIDAKVGLTAVDMQILELLEENPARLLLVATKTDQLPKAQRKVQLGRIASALELPLEAVFAVSAKEGWGLEPLWENLLPSLTFSQP